MSALPIPIDARRSKLWFSDLPRLLENAVADYDFASQKDFVPLAELSANTLFEDIEVDSNSIVVSDRGWEAAGAVYVTLRYDLKSDDPVEMNEGFPVIVRFDVVDGKVVVNSIEPDVQSFYA